MDRNAPADAPLVLMTNVGAAGRFNRAQRAAFNTDENLPLFLANTLIAGAIFGKAVLLLAMLSATGRVIFALAYTEAADKRGNGLTMSFIGEKWMEGLVAIFIKIDEVFFC